MARIAALVVAYRSFDEIEPLAASIADATTGTEHTVDIYAIENSQDPQEFARLAALPQLHRVVPNDENLGYGGGMNALAKQLDGQYDWILICNPDIRFWETSIAELVAAGERHPRGALFGPLIRASDGPIYPSARAFPSIRTGVGHAMFANLWPTNPWTRRYHSGGSTDLPIEKTVDWLSGACLMVRPSAFVEAGGFDEGFFMYFEDVDLALRLNKLGWEAVFVPTAVITHSGAHSTSTQADTMRRVHHESARRYLDKKYTGWWLAPVRLVLRVGLYARQLLHSKMP